MILCLLNILESNMHWQRRMWFDILQSLLIEWIIRFRFQSRDQLFYCSRREQFFNFLLVLNWRLFLLLAVLQNYLLNSLVWIVWRRNMIFNLFINFRNAGTWNKVISESSIIDILSFDLNTCWDILSKSVSQSWQDIARSYISKESKLILWHCENSSLSCDSKWRVNRDTNTSSHYNPIPVAYLNTLKLTYFIITNKFISEEDRS